jgi:hypothetical protein
MAFTKYSDEVIERFEEKVDKKGDDECWLWNACKSKDGYGQFWRNGKMIYAHRIALELHLQREITAGLLVCHAAGICHNRACVNPRHLREDTWSANMLDKHVDGTMIIAKLTAEQVLQIRASGKSQRELGREYGVHQSTISEIILRKIWGHVK